MLGLLPQPGGFEGFLLIAKAPKLQDLPVANLSDPSRWLVKDNAAFATPSKGASQDEYSAANVAELVRLDAELRPGCIDVRPELLVATQTAIDGSLQATDKAGTNLDLVIEDGGGGDEISIGERSEQSLYHLDVLLRHRPRSISRRAGSGSGETQGGHRATAGWVSARVGGLVDGDYCTAPRAARVLRRDGLEGSGGGSDEPLAYSRSPAASRAFSGSL
jgi:hypothetical protein